MLETATTYLVELLQEPVHCFPLALQLLDLFHSNPAEKLINNEFIYRGVPVYNKVQGSREYLSKIEFSVFSIYNE